jgi:hypothetical protein
VSAVQGGLTIPSAGELALSGLREECAALDAAVAAERCSGYLRITFVVMGVLKKWRGSRSLHGVSAEPALDWLRTALLEHNSVRRRFMLPAGAAAVILCALAVYTGWYVVSNGGVGYDAHAYWLAGRSAHPYQASPGQFDAFLYSPVFALLMRPLAMLPWLWFVTVWIVAESCALWWLVSALRWQWQVLWLLLCIPELCMGNIYGFLGVAAVVGIRWPEAWAFPILTKVTPGGVGILWFAVRGEWKKVARAGTATLVLSAVSFAVTPSMWKEWLAFLLKHGGENGARVPVFLGIAGVLTVVAARTDRAWLLTVAMMIAVPTFTGKNKDLAMLVAAPRLQQEHSRERLHRERELATVPRVPSSGGRVAEGTRQQASGD